MSTGTSPPELTEGAMGGVFVEQAADRHIPLRERLLAAGAALPAPSINTPAVRAADFPDRGGDALLAHVDAHGLGAVLLDRPLPDDRFAALGCALGRAMPETDPSLQRYVTGEVILNLITEHDVTQNVDLQPFAANHLTLHSEGSGRPAAEQPRYIVLMCVEPGAATAAQTVLVPMAAAARRLTPEQLRILSRTRYRRNERGPSILRAVGNRWVFSFRDFEAQPLEWIYTGDDRDLGEVNPAIRALLAAVYTPGLAAGIRWTAGLVVVIDNTFFFHGRTADRLRHSARRHLKRLRIVE